MEHTAVDLALDPESREWLQGLRGEGSEREQAVVRLHALLLRAARFETDRRRAMLPHIRGDDLDDLANQAADDALMSVLRRLEDFRGASRFTTWAYKFALLEAAVKARRRAWQRREITIDDEAWRRIATHGGDELEAQELLAAIAAAIPRCLTDHQRRVLTALALDGVPVDVLAERLDTTRGALYKTLHDARRKLRAALADAGHSLDDYSTGDRS